MRTLHLLLMVMVFTYSTHAQKLEKIWTSSSELKTPESVLYDPEMDVLLVTNMGTELDVKTSDGFISMLTPDGEIENLKWINGLNDPKGMAIRENRLYVADLDELVVLDIEHASAIKKYHDVNAKFLNDVAVTDDGIVFVSDMKNQCIYALQDGVFSIWLIDSRLDNVNGLWVENGKLYAGNASIWEIDIETKEMKDVVTGTEAVDGLEKIDPNTFVFSIWSGKIFVSVGSEVINLLDTSEAKLNTADLDYIPTTKTLVVPSFFGNTIEAYQLTFD